MALIPWRPFRELERWFEQEWPDIWEWREKWLSRFPLSDFIRTPRVDVYETNGNVVAEIELPGVEPKDIDLEVEKDAIKVEAKREQKKEEKKKGYYRKELSQGYYKRIVPLPVEVQEKKAKAVYKDGVLKVEIPKVKPKEEKKKGVKIEIKTK